MAGPSPFLTRLRSPPVWEKDCCQALGFWGSGQGEEGAVLSAEWAPGRVAGVLSAPRQATLYLRKLAALPPLGLEWHLLFPHRTVSRR